MKWPTIPSPDVSLRDLHIYGGLGLAAVGGCQLSPALTAIALGSALVLIGVLGPLLERKAN